MRNKLIVAAAAALFGLSLSAGNAFAGTDVFNLTVTASDFQVIASGTEGSDLIYSSVSAPLNGVAPIVISQGDNVTVNVKLDQLYTIPASSDETLLVLDLTGSDASDKEVGDFTFYNGSNLVGTYDFSDGSGGALGSLAVLPSTAAISFDSFTDNFDVTELNASASFTSGYFQYIVIDKVSAAPEPSTWLLMIAGVGCGGLLLRRAKIARSFWFRDAFGA